MFNSNDFLEMAISSVNIYFSFIQAAFIYHLICVVILLDVRIKSKINNMILNLNRFTLQTKRHSLTLFFKWLHSLQHQTDYGRRGERAFERVSG